MTPASPLKTPFGLLPSCCAVVLAGLMLAAGAPGAGAATVQDLFIAEAPVTDRSEEARQAGFQNALAQVLVRLTGSRGAPADPAVATLLENAAAYVQQFGYMASGRLRVGFDGKALQAAAQAQGLSVWGASRPATLVWLALDNGGGDRRLLAADDDSEAARQLRTAATARGLPLVLPLMDSEDRAAVSFPDVWGGFDDNILAASQRYGADAVLVGRASRGASGVFVRWKLRAGGLEDEWRGSLENGIHRTTDAFARRFAVQSGVDTGGAVVVRVSGIDDLAAYGDVYTYLESLTLVSRVAVDVVAAGQVSFRLDLRGDPGQLERAVSLGNVLRTEETGPLSTGLSFVYTP